MNFERFIQLCITNGGASYNPNYGTFNPKTGYMVSIPDYERVVTGEDQLKLALQDVLAKSVDLTYHDPNYYIGAWFNHDNGKWYVDVSINVADLREAIETGVRYGQLAIYDCGADKVINLPTPQTAGTSYQKQSYMRKEIDRLIEGV